MNPQDWLHYTGKRVAVSGCHSGIGHATARQLVALGAEVHGLDTKACDLGLASFTQLDLRDAASSNAATARLTGRIDGAVQPSVMLRKLAAYERQKPVGR